MRIERFLWTGAAAVLFSCSQPDAPALPQVELDEAAELTRDGALLTGRVRGSVEVAAEACRFCYGSSPAMEQTAPAVREGSGLLTVRLTDLVPGTTYYCCLELAGAVNTLRSTVRQFQTLPKLVPAIGAAELVSKGPLSMELRCAVTDDGGEAYSRIGFLLREEGSATDRFVAGTVGSDRFWAQVDGLRMGTSYTVRACAANSLGECLSEPITVQTNTAIVVSTPGTLARIVGDAWKYQMEEIAVAGSLNGTDLRFLREMLGRDADGQATEGRLTSLNLQDARIVQGGESYAMGRYTADDRLGIGLFGGCDRLRQLSLPHGLVAVEEDALRGCAALTTLELPASLTSIAFSAGCSALASYALAAGNHAFAVVDGVLYSADGTRLVLCPPGKSGDSFTCPTGVKSVGERAFGESALGAVTVPDGVTTLDRLAFAGATLRQVTLGNGVLTVPTGCFQGCAQLEKVVLGDHVRRVGDYAFEGCTALRAVEMRNAELPAYTESAFTKEQLQTVTLTVPQGCRKLYAGSAWGGFSRIVEAGDGVASAGKE